MLFCPILSRSFKNLYIFLIVIINLVIAGYISTKVQVIKKLNTAKLSKSSNELLIHINND